MQHIFESIKGISPPCRIPVKFADAIFGIISGKDDVIDKEKKEYGKMENLKERFIFRNILPEEADQAALITLTILIRKTARTFVRAVIRYCFKPLR